MWYDTAEMWDWWETVFQIHYDIDYRGYEVADYVTDYYGGVDTTVFVANRVEPMRLQLKANSTKNIHDLPVDFAYVNEQAHASGFGLYFDNSHNITTFVFGYPYSNVTLVVSYNGLRTFWENNYTVLTNKFSKKGKGENRYVRLPLHTFVDLLGENNYRLYVFDYA